MKDHPEVPEACSLAAWILTRHPNAKPPRLKQVRDQLQSFAPTLRNRIIDLELKALEQPEPPDSNPAREEVAELPFGLNRARLEHRIDALSK